MSGHHLKYIFAVTKIDADVTFFLSKQKRQNWKKNLRTRSLKQKHAMRREWAGFESPIAAQLFGNYIFENWNRLPKKLKNRLQIPKGDSKR